MTENLNKKPPKGILKSSSSFDTASCGGNGGRRSSGVGVVEGPSGCSRQCSNELSVEGDACGDNGVEGYVHQRKHSKTAKFDEMNILETYHPATKDYGHMKVDEPKTPFNYLNDEEDEAETSSSQSSKRRSKEINADELLKKLTEAKEAEGAVGGVEQPEEESSEDDAEETEEEKAARIKFESKRKAHYNEYYAVKLARKLMEEDPEDEEEDEKVGEEEEEDGVEQPEKFIPVEETGVAEESGGGGDRMED